MGIYCFPPMGSGLLNPCNLFIYLVEIKIEEIYKIPQLLLISIWFQKNSNRVGWKHWE